VEEELIDHDYVFNESREKREAREEQERMRQRGNEEGIHFLPFLRYYRCGLTAKVDKPGVKGWVPAAQRGKGASCQ